MCDFSLTASALAVLPRRVAATGVATRVAEEVGCDLGTDVGYAVRFDNAISVSLGIGLMPRLLPWLCCAPFLALARHAALHPAHQPHAQP